MSVTQTPLQDPPQKAEAAPVLSKDAVRAVIARRLRALGHPPDLLDNQAVAALTEHAQGSGMRLRAALAATLFLASTEDAPRIGRALVQRALLESGDIPAAPPVRQARRWQKVALAGVLACAAVASVLVFRPVARHADRAPDAGPKRTALAQAGPPASPQVAVSPPAVPPQAVSKPPEPPPALPPEPAQEAPSPAPPAPAPLAPATQTQPGPAQLGPAPPAPTQPGSAQPAPAVTAPPTAPTATPATLPPDLPDSPSASVVLIVSARDAASARRLYGLVQHLHEAGIAQVETQNASSTRARRAISYFFADDLPLAQRITQVLAQDGWPHLTGNSLTPRLVIPPPGIAPRRPGLIEIQLP